jgi:hypothetical protein
MRCNQVKKEEGASCACTNASAHNNKDRDNVAAPNTFNFTRMPLAEHATTAVSPRQSLLELGRR